MSKNIIKCKLSKISNESNIIIENEVKEGKNKHFVKCQFCSSRILNPGLGIYSESEFDLPMMTKKKKSLDCNEDVEFEKLKYFWKINDMYTFENICFSNTVDSIKYLACADCEVGPVGYYNMKTKISYVALARVNHVI